jgi:hypothetical protein
MRSYVCYVILYYLDSYQYLMLSYTVKMIKMIKMMCVLGVANEGDAGLCVVMLSYVILCHIIILCRLILSR